MKTPKSKIQVFFVIKIPELGFFWSFIRTPLKLGFSGTFSDFPNLAPANLIFFACGSQISGGLEPLRIAFFHMKKKIWHL